ncbi:urea ABC transporter ATP-binding subunit UrtE [Burkholderia sp. WAC0059]|uniref:urea ABC transporter ATP-binding subunit UrtE n=1 Tax=Burkholderia sp. WAC0059 TaxID=2066022 RepID=UPI000C7EED74|nr:urea ABC transporter ATP-binding subunit UrtE [Burkholderia sp. WAC0059]PLZ03047.1 urea ABC transporter ATP-binding subunit UrtE [Burkholderia sp. WAC0059]
MLTISDLNQYYGSSHTLRGVSLSVAEGTCTVLLGRNGVGKTTLLKCLVGLLPVKSGAIALRGHDLLRLPAHRRALAGLGYVPQGREIFPLLTVEENLLIGAYTGERASEKQFSFEDVFNLFPVLRQMRSRIAGNLSGGQQQQLAIGRALLTNPSLLILDEPTEGIQPSIVKEIEAVILSLKGSLSILLVEQFFDFAQSVADHYVVLVRGQVASAGRGDEMDANDVRSLIAV